MNASAKNLDGLLPEVAGIKEEAEKPAGKVFQGKEMREEASWLSKFLFSYAEPLLYSSLKERISFEQYGLLPEHLKVKYEVDKLQANMDYYVKKDR